MNPDCQIRKKEEHKKRLMGNMIMKGKLTNNEAHNRQLEGKIQSLMKVGTSMAVLLSNANDANPQAFQDKMKELVANFNKHSASPINAQAPALILVSSEVPTQVALIDNTATSVSTPLHQFTPVQPGNQ